MVIHPVPRLPADTKEREPHGSCDTDMVPSRLPTPEELAKASDTLEEGLCAIGHAWWTVRRISRANEVDHGDVERGLVEGDQLPTLADLGALYVFRGDVQSRVDQIVDYLENIDEAMSDLQTVMAIYGGNDA